MVSVDISESSCINRLICLSKIMEVKTYHISISNIIFNYVREKNSTSSTIVNVTVKLKKSERINISMQSSYIILECVLSIISFSLRKTFQTQYVLNKSAMLK